MKFSAPGPARSYGKGGRYGNTFARAKASAHGKGRGSAPEVCAPEAPDNRIHECGVRISDFGSRLPATGEDSGGRKAISDEQSQFGGVEIGGNGCCRRDLPAGGRATAPENKAISWKTGGPGDRRDVQLPISNFQFGPRVRESLPPKDLRISGRLGNFPFRSKTFRNFPFRSVLFRLFPVGAGCLRVGCVDGPAWSDIACGRERAAPHGATNVGSVEASVLRRRLARRRAV